MTGNPPTDNYQIVPRTGLDFQLRSDDIPKYWFGGDAFKSRFFDAMSLLFPDGERFFIQCVRDFSDQIKDPELQADVRNFMFQEAQHGRVHTEFNNRVARQGIDVPEIERRQLEVLGWYRRKTPRKYTLAYTAAAEHMTAMMAHFFLDNPQDFAAADPRIRAIYFWHAIEEIEHKAVAFDVMQKVAGVGYGMRCLAMLNLSLAFPFHVMMIMRYMLKVDGFTRGQRLKLWAKGLWWMYGPRGVYAKMLGHYVSYYRPGYHPWKKGETRAFQQWRTQYEAHDNDAVAATSAFLEQMT